MDFTDVPTLNLIAKRRGIDPKVAAQCQVMCGECGAPMTQVPAQGIAHWPDCAAEWSRVLFSLEQPDGSWKEQGYYPGEQTRSPVMTFTVD